MIISDISEDCDVYICEEEGRFHFLVNGNLLKNQFVLPNVNEAIKECLWLRTLGIEIPECVIDKMRNDNVQITND